MRNVNGCDVRNDENRPNREHDHEAHGSYDGPLLLFESVSADPNSDRRAKLGHLTVDIVPCSANCTKSIT